MAVPFPSVWKTGSDMLSPDKLALPRVQAHVAYVPGEQPPATPDVIKLNTNENPYPPSPRITEALQVATDKLRLYPNPTAKPLRAAIAELHELEPEQVLAGNGSDDVLNLCTRCFADAERPVGMTTPSYSLYPTLASLQGAPLVEIPFEEDFALDPTRIASCGANLFFLTTPNAPAGVAFPNHALKVTLDAFPGIFVADEAYADFAPGSAVPLLSEHPLLLVTRSLSKSYGLAGIRVGYALGSPELVAVLDKAREVYNVDRLAQTVALAAIRDQDYFREITAKTLATRARTLNDFRSRGWKTYDSATNFLFTEPRDAAGNTGSEVASSLFGFLEDNRILVRRFPNHPLTSSFLRISIGDDNQMQILTETIEQWATDA